MKSTDTDANNGRYRFVYSQNFDKWLEQNYPEVYRNPNDYLIILNGSALIIEKREKYA